MFFDSKPEEGCNVFKYIKYWYMNYMSVFISFINMSFVCILSNSVEWWQSCWYWGFGESPNHQTNHSPQKVVQVSQVCERYQNFNAFLKKYNILKNISYNNVLNNCLLNNLYIKVKDCSLYNKMKGNFNSKNISTY